MFDLERFRGFTTEVPLATTISDENLETTTAGGSGERLGDNQDVYYFNDVEYEEWVNVKNTTLRPGIVNVTNGQNVSEEEYRTTTYYPIVDRNENTFSTTDRSEGESVKLLILNISCINKIIIPFYKYFQFHL